jgi:hypothetical protein
MGPAIIIPVIILVVVVPVAFKWARETFKSSSGGLDDGMVQAPGSRLTSAALRELSVPTWRVVYEVAEGKLGEVEHVLIGPPGVFAIQTSMDELTERPAEEPDAHAIAEAAIARSDLDDALGRCAMASDRLVRVHWGATADGAPAAVDVFPGLTSVGGRSLGEWANGLPGALSAAQVDLAWQTVTTAIGRPDPLA